MSQDLQSDVSSFFRELESKINGAPVSPDDVPEDTPLDEAREAMAAQEGPPEPAIPEAVVAEDEEDRRYPGSKRERRSAPVEEDEVEAPVWDTHPRHYILGGKQTELFPISALATALRREAVTIRKWETKGYLPSARYRSPGGGKKQDRLYTRRQIEGLIALATEEGLMEPAKKMRIDQTKFPERAERLFNALDRSHQ